MSVFCLVSWGAVMAENSTCTCACLSMRFFFFFFFFFGGGGAKSGNNIVVINHCIILVIIVWQVVDTKERMAAVRSLLCLAHGMFPAGEVYFHHRSYRVNFWKLITFSFCSCTVLVNQSGIIFTLMLNINNQYALFSH